LKGYKHIVFDLNFETGRVIDAKQRTT